MCENCVQEQLHDRGVFSFVNDSNLVGTFLLFSFNHLLDEREDVNNNNRYQWNALNNRQQVLAF